jgi:hypothetical protein
LNGLNPGCGDIKQLVRDALSWKTSAVCRVIPTEPGLRYDGVRLPLKKGALARLSERKQLR